MRRSPGDIAKRDRSSSLNSASSRCHPRLGAGSAGPEQSAKCPIHAASVATGGAGMASTPGRRAGARGPLRSIMPRPEQVGPQLLAGHGALERTFDRDRHLGAHASAAPRLVDRRLGVAGDARQLRFGARNSDGFLQRGGKRHNRMITYVIDKSTTKIMDSSYHPGYGATHGARREN